MSLSVSPSQGSAACVQLKWGQTQAFDFTDSGNPSQTFTFSINGGNTVVQTDSNTATVTANIPGFATLSAVSASGEIINVPLCIGTQADFCVDAVIQTAEAVSGEGGLGSAQDACCELDVECGDSIQLNVPSFYLNVGGTQVPIVYNKLDATVSGEYSALLSTAAPAGATGNIIPSGVDAYFAIVTSFDMAATANGNFGVGFSETDIDSTIATMQHGVVWTTVSGTRYVRVYHNGAVEGTNQFAIAQGDAVAFGVIDNRFRLSINGLERFVSGVCPNFCGNYVLDISINTSNKTVGGAVSNLSWSIQTSGTPDTVGAINANGLYVAPQHPISGTVSILGTVNAGQFPVKVRTIKPTPRLTHPQPFLNGRSATIWVTADPATDMDIPRLAANGSPDAIQNPGMIELGVLEASAKFAEDISYQDFTNDNGIFDSKISAEKASLEATFLEIRDLRKLSVLMQHGTLHPLHKGARRFSVGGKRETVNLRVFVVAVNGEGGYDLLYLPKVQNRGNLNFEIGRQAGAKYPLNMSVLPDFSLPEGEQLYSIYQRVACSHEATTATTACS